MTCPSCQADNDHDAGTCFRCGRALFALTRGHVLAGRYEILEVLGRGGMGVVYAAHDRELDERVAIKVLRPDVALSPEMARRFRDEIKLARRVRHRNVCGIHEFGHDGPVPFIAMELVDGIDLKRLIRSEGPLQPVDAFDVAIQVAKGLSAIHEVGILHRDLKTPNIMRDVRGAIRLMDFGIAKSVDGTRTGTSTGAMVGTPEYMSPEQIRGEQLDARSDVYALGVVVFELFTGAVPFRGDSTLSTVYMHLNQPPPLTGPVAARLPAAVVPVLARALAKAPEERHPSARGFGDALREAREATLPGESATPPPWRILTAAVPVTQTDLHETPATATLLPRTPPPQPATARPTTPLPRRPAWRAHPRATIAGAALAVALVAAGVLAGRARQAGEPSEARPAPALDSGDSGSLVAAVTPAAVAPRPIAAPAAPSPVTAPVESRTDRPEQQRTVAAEKSRDPPARSQAEIAPPARDVAPAPVGSPTPAPTAVASASAVADLQAGTEQARSTGELRVRAVPWAEVTIDEMKVGTTPFRPIPLAPGAHTVRLAHPDYKPVERRVVVRAGETVRLDVDFAREH